MKELSPSTVGLTEKVTKLQHLFRETLTENNAKTALVFEKETLSFAELHKKSEALGCFLRSAYPLEEVIGVSCKPSIQMLISILGILKANKAFLPLDIHCCKEKIQKVIADTELKYLLCDSSEEGNFASFGLLELNEKTLSYGQNDFQNTLENAVESKYAYIVFTSGSGGAIKGIKIKHESILNYIQNAIQNYCTVGESNGFFHLNLGFDASLTALFTALATGKAVVIASDKYKSRFEDPNFLSHAPYDFIKLTPYQFFELEDLNDKRVFYASKRFVVGGEALYKSHLNAFYKYQIQAEIYNEYGPSETGVGSVLYKFQSLDFKLPNDCSIPIGKAMPGVSVYISENPSDKLKTERIGEIILGGVQVSEAYISNPVLSNEKFFQKMDEYNQETINLYKTGDYAFYNQDGDISFICREERIKFHENHKENLEKYKLIYTLLEARHVILAENTDLINDLEVYYVFCEQNSLNFAFKNILETTFKQTSRHLTFIFIDHIPLTINKKLNKYELPYYKLIFKSGKCLNEIIEALEKESENKNVLTIYSESRNQDIENKLPVEVFSNKIC